MHVNIIKLREEVISPKVRFAMAYQFLDKAISRLIWSYTFEPKALDALRDAQSLMGRYIDHNELFYKKRVKETLEPIPSEIKNKIYLLLNGKAAFLLYDGWHFFYNDYYKKTFIERLDLKENTFYLVDNLE